jgi:hypothetical protein
MMKYFCIVLFHRMGPHYGRILSVRQLNFTLVLGKILLPYVIFSFALTSTISVENSYSPIIHLYYLHRFCDDLQSYTSSRGAIFGSLSKDSRCSYKLKRYGNILLSNIDFNAGALNNQNLNLVEGINLNFYDDLPFYFPINKL